MIRHPPEAADECEVRPVRVCPRPRLGAAQDEALLEQEQEAGAPPPRHHRPRPPAGPKQRYEVSKTGYQHNVPIKSFYEPLNGLLTPKLFKQIIIQKFNEL